MKTKNMEANRKYDVTWFIAKFQAIPDDAWCTDNYMRTYRNWLGKKKRDTSTRCAQGHCMRGVVIIRKGFSYHKDSIPELEALREIFGNVREGSVTYYAVALINNGEDLRYQQPTPKLRILAALQDIKAKQDMDDSIRAAKKAVDDFMDFAKEVKALKEPKREIVYVKLEVDLVEANPN